MKQIFSIILFIAIFIMKPHILGFKNIKESGRILVYIFFFFFFEKIIGFLEIFSDFYSSLFAITIYNQKVKYIYLLCKDVGINTYINKYKENI